MYDKATLLWIMHWTSVVVVFLHSVSWVKPSRRWNEKERSWIVPLNSWQLHRNT